MMGGSNKREHFRQRVRTFFKEKYFLHNKVFMLSAISTILLLLTVLAAFAQNSTVVQVQMNGYNQPVATDAENVEELLAELDVEVRPQDEVSPDPHTPLESDMKIVWDQAKLVSLKQFGEESDIWTTASNVEQLLQEKNIQLEDGDVVNPGLDFDIEHHMFVEVAHYKTEIVEREFEMDYETIEKDDPTVTEGEEIVLNSGEEGLNVHQYEVTYKNGEVIRSELIETDVKEEVQDRLVAVGTKEETEPKQKSATRTAAVDEDDASNEEESSGSEASDESSSSSSAGSSSSSEGSSSSGSNSEGRTLQVQSTAYTADCSGCSGYSATGLNLKDNPDKKVIAVDPDVIPLGSTVEVEGYGTAVAGDTGGAIQGNKIDVFVPSAAEAESWGRRSVTITIID